MSSKRLYHGSPHDLQMIEPRVATGKDGPEAQRNAVYMSASPDEAALYALVRPAVGRRGGWAIRGGNVHYVEDPRIPLNTEGYVYHADIPDGQYRQPPQTNPQIGYTVDSAVAPQGKTRVTLDDHRRRFISYPDKDALRSALAGMTTDQEKMAEVATKKDPTLWQEAKRDAVRRMDGVHSARAMQLASKLYKERGGTYAGKKPAPSQNSLRTWTKQKWKWSEGDRPGQGGEGVYLPSKSVSALKSTASGREKLRQAREVKEDATSRGQQFSQHGLHMGKQRGKTAALSPQRYEEITPQSRAPALLVEDPMNNTSRHIKTAAPLDVLQRAARMHRSKFLPLDPHMPRIDQSINRLKDRMNAVVTSAGGPKSLTDAQKSEYIEMKKMREKLLRFKSPRTMDFSPKEIPDFHDGTWRQWVASKGRGMPQETSDALKHGGETFGTVMEQSAATTRGGRAIVQSPPWDDLAVNAGRESIISKTMPSNQQAKEFMRVNADLHEVDEFKNSIIADRARNLRQGGIRPVQINKNHHVGVDPLVLDMNRANTATGVGAAEFKDSIKKTRWDELDFLQRNLPGEPADLIARLKTGKRINRHARKKLNRAWADFSDRYGSAHDHQSSYTKSIGPIKTAALRAFLASNTKLAAVRHTLITGHSGAGKTTLARSFGLPIHSLDDDPDIRAQLEFQKQYREQNDGRLPVGGEYAVRMRAAEQAAIRRALALRAPHAIEGSYLLNTAPTDYPTHALHLVDVDPELAVRQRVERQRIKDLAKGRGWGPERAAGVAMRGRQLVEEYEPGAMRWRNDPNVVKHKRSDTDKIASIYADRSTQTMFNESASGLEGRMVLRQLDEVCNMAQELMQVIPEEADVPEWVQNPVATINDRLKSVHSYVVYEMKRSGPSMDSAGMIQQAQQLAPDMSEMSSDPHEMDELQAKTSAYRAAMWQAFNRTLYGR